MSLLGNNSYVMNDATSLRMSDMGYSNAAQQSLKVCFNNLPSYIRTLHTALHTAHPPYAAIGLGSPQAPKQLNTNVLQIENEYYSDIRPKHTTLTGEKPIAALHRAGVEYVEIRCLDLNPYLPLGMDADQLRFMSWFLLWCLLSDSPAISDVECERLSFNQRLTVLHGRDPALKLVTDDQSITLRDWGSQILDEILALVAAIEPADAPLVRKAIDRYRGWLEDPSLTPSGQMCQQMQANQVEFRDLVQALAVRHRQQLQAQPLAAEVQARLAQAAAESRHRQAELEAQSNGSFIDYVEQFLAQTEHLELADDAINTNEVLV
jgi:glutamate--cysteine ligase